MIRLLLAALLLLSSAFSVPPAKAAGPRLEGGYLYLPYLTSASVPLLLDEWKSLGMTTVVTSELRIKANCTDDSYAWTPGSPDILGVVLKQAAKRNMQVFVGLVFSSGACTSFEQAPNNWQDATQTDWLVGEVLRRFGRPASLAGWSITNEPALAWETREEVITARNSYYFNQQYFVHAHSALPVVTAPYLGGVLHAADGTVQTPQQVADKTGRFLNDTGVNTLIWQDSMQTESLPSTTAQTYYDALVQRHGPARIWADVELGEPDNSATDIVRLKGQLTASGATGRRLSWLPQYHLSLVSNNRQAGAERLYADYFAYSR